MKTNTNTMKTVEYYITKIKQAEDRYTASRTKLAGRIAESIAATHLLEDALALYAEECFIHRTRLLAVKGYLVELAAGKTDLIATIANIQRIHDDHVSDLLNPHCHCSSALENIRKAVEAHAKARAIRFFKELLGDLRRAD